MIRDAALLLFMISCAFAGGGLIFYQLGYSCGFRRGAAAVMAALEKAEPGQPIILKDGGGR